MTVADPPQPMLIHMTQWAPDAPRMPNGRPHEARTPHRRPKDA